MKYVRKIKGMKVLSIAIVLCTLLSISDCFAWRFAGFEITKDGIRRQEVQDNSMSEERKEQLLEHARKIAREQSQEQQAKQEIKQVINEYNTEKQKDSQDLEQLEIIDTCKNCKQKPHFVQVNATDLRDFVNSHKHLTDNMKEYAGDSFCIKTQSRTLPFYTYDDGSIALLSEEPDKCYELKTSEQFLNHIWEKRNQAIPFEEIEKGVEIPFRLRIRAAWKWLNPFA